MHSLREIKIKDSKDAQVKQSGITTRSGRKWAVDIRMLKRSCLTKAASHLLLQVQNCPKFLFYLVNSLSNGPFSIVNEAHEAVPEIKIRLN